MLPSDSAHGMTHALPLNTAFGHVCLPPTSGCCADYQPPGIPLRPELRIVTLAHEEEASDALSVRGYAAWLPNSYTLVPSYSNIEALMAFDSALGGSSSSAALGAGGVDQVAGAGEFMYFIVSPQVGQGRQGSHTQACAC
jgi:hypothetical protein